MATLRPDAVLNDVRDLFDLGVVSNLTDGHLLDRVAARDSEHARRAFTVLVERHGAMVLHVCRQILRDPHDVEDAFQATFLVLLRKARAIRKPRSCASWLHGVALRSAAAIRSETARRRWHERQAAKDPEVAVIPCVTEPADDPQRAIDEELGRLQDRYRAPLILCYLEGRTCEDAAQQLGCPVGTVKSRLARGRERLRRRLVRRGLAPVLGLATTLDLPALAKQTVPPRLATIVSEAAARVLAGGAVAGSVACIVRAELKRGLVRRAARLGAAMVGMGVVVSVLGLLGAGKDDVDAPRAAAGPGKVETEPIYVRVIDREEKPVAGVAVRVVGKRQSTTTETTDANGRLVVPRDWVDDYVTFLAAHGDSVGWARGDLRPPRQAGTTDQPVVLVLLPVNHKVEGSVVDANDRPIANVLIVVDTVSRSGELAVFVPHLQSETAGWPFASAVTDENGRYTLILPEKSNASLCAVHPRFIGPWIAARENVRMIDPTTLEPTGRITGKVIDAATGAPVAGARLAAQFLEHHSRILRGRYGECVSDARGEFSQGSLEPGVYNLAVWNVPGREHAVAPAVEAVRVRALEDTHAELRVIDGRPLRGVVSNPRTNQPVPGVLVGCYGSGHPHTGAAVDGKRTDSQGRFTFFVPPGEHFVYVMEGPSMTRLSRGIVVVPEQGEAECVRLIWNSGPSNQPVGIAKAIYNVAVKPDGAAATKGPATPAPPEPKTPEGRTVTGLVTDKEGLPLPGVDVSIGPEGSAPGGPPPPYETAVTDRTGVFIMRNLPRHALTLVFNRPDVANSAPLLHPVGANQNVVDFVFAPGPKQRPAYRHEPPRDEELPPGLKERLTFVNLDPRGDEFLADGPGDGGNDLARLPRGVHKLGAAYYRVGEKLVHLQGLCAPGLPDSVEGIVVGARGHTLHLVHAMQFGAPTGAEVGAYTIRYVDGTKVRIPVVYGRDVVNWWSFPRGVQETPSHAAVAWVGSNDDTDLNDGVVLRLFATTWTNPHPDRAIATVDVTSKGTGCDLFLVALTLERSAPPGPKER